jgi:hypothetical protein
MNAVSLEVLPSLAPLMPTAKISNPDFVVPVKKATLETVTSAKVSTPHTSTSHLPTAVDHCKEPVPEFGKCAADATCKPTYPGIQCTCNPGKFLNLTLSLKIQMPFPVTNFSRV